LSLFRVASPLLVVLALVAFGGRREVPRVGPDTDANADADEGGTPVVEDPDPDDEAGVGDDLDSDDDSDLDDDIGLDVDRSTMASGDAGKKKRRRGGCRSSMVRVRDVCIDRYEAPNRRGAKPLVMQTANDAASWCEARHKRLCTEDEWIAACEGEEHRSYPYGSEHVDGRCNDDKPWRQVDEGTLAKWPDAEAQEHAKSLYQAARSGSKRKCVSQAGVRDLTGNVEEWVVRTREHANDWPYLLIGCYWSGCYGGGKPTCHSTNNAHGPEFRFYETGFRCCRDAGSARAK
jgi:formylglycine-generating enzyme required for sulfatase activity